jgi:hypothetical protein
MVENVVNFHVISNFFVEILTILIVFWMIFAYFIQNFYYFYIKYEFFRNNPFKKYEIASIFFNIISILIVVLVLLSVFY